MSGTMKFTDSPEQAAVVQAPSYADVVVVAGAGSGKTYTMTRRIITLIEQGVSPEKILGLTFTRKAASELLSRVSAAVTRDQRERGLKSANMTFLKPEVSTYDAFFQSIVRQYGLLVARDHNWLKLRASYHRTQIIYILAFSLLTYFYCRYHTSILLSRSALNSLIGIL